MPNSNLDIPASVWEKLKGLDDHPEVEDTIRDARRFGAKSIDTEIIAETNGCLLVCFPVHGAKYMLKLPTGQWISACIATTEYYAKTCLEQKYGMQRIFSTFIDWANAEVPIYIEASDYQAYADACKR